MNSVLKILGADGGDITDDGSDLLSDSEGVPASDRVVELDHNDREYREAVGAVDELIEAVTSSNEFGNEVPAEKDAILAALKAGRSLLEQTRVRLSTVNATLLPAVQFCAKTFTVGVIAAAGAKAFELLMTLFGPF